MRISTLSDAECKSAIADIVLRFGDGRVKRGQYVFDAITRLPAGYGEMRLTLRQLVSRLIHYSTLQVVFDPNPANNPSRLHLLHTIGIDEDVGGVEIAPGDLLRFFAGTDCDFYLVAPDKALLGVASHENESEGNEPLMWCPVAPT